MLADSGGKSTTRLEKTLLACLDFSEEGGFRPRGREIPFPSSMKQAVITYHGRLLRLMRHMSGKC